VGVDLELHDEFKLVIIGRGTNAIGQGRCSGMGVAVVELEVEVALWAAVCEGLRLLSGGCYS
jgi:hypothetical protein